MALYANGRYHRYPKAYPFDGLSLALSDKSYTTNVYETNLKNFNHVIISERFTESLLVFMNKMNLRLTDLLYIPSKGRISRNLTESELNFFSLHINSKNRIDSHLHTKAIEILEKEFKSLPSSYKNLKGVFEKMLQEVRLACSSPKDLRDCYWRDNGCAKTCINNWIKNNIQCQKVGA